MTNEEKAFERIEAICEINIANGICTNCYDGCHWNYVREALEKQIPKKPTNIYKRCGYIVKGCCKRCGESVLPEQKFCSNCGQRIDWSEEERRCSNCKWNGTKCYEAPEGLKCNDCTQWCAID